MLRLMCRVIRKKTWTFGIDRQENINYLEKQLTHAKNDPVRSIGRNGGPNEEMKKCAIDMKKTLTDNRFFWLAWIILL